MAMRRFRVVEDSMLPILRPGDEFVATTSLVPTVGDIVATVKPGTDDFWLVKRVGSHPQPRPGEIWLVSDNPRTNAIDSTTFGPVPIDGALRLVDRLDDQRFVEACQLLAAEDETLGALIETLGLPDFWRRKPGFPTLTLLILEQQVSLESGAAVFGRLRDELGRVTPATVLDMGPERLRQLGVTRQKAGYIVELALAIAEGRLDLEELSDASTERSRSRLTALRGIGPWTADAYLLSALGHLDVFPIGDRALQVGTGEILGLSTPPSPEELEILSEPWRPIRSAAARLIWHSYLTARGRVEPEVAL